VDRAAEEGDPTALHILEKEAEWLYKLALAIAAKYRPFLKNTHEDWLDPFKSEVSNDIIDVLLKYIDKSEDDPDYLLHLTNCIFLCDSVSEEALKVQCRLLIQQGKLSIAKKTYDRFVNEYRILYDDTYEFSFNEVIGQQ